MARRRGRVQYRAPVCMHNEWYTYHDPVKYRTVLTCKHCKETQYRLYTGDYSSSGEMLPTESFTYFPNFKKV